MTMGVIPYRHRDQQWPGLSSANFKPKEVFAELLNSGIATIDRGQAGQEADTVPRERAASLQDDDPPG